jgi:hypothetical protein
MRARFSSSLQRQNATQSNKGDTPSASPDQQSNVSSSPDKELEKSTHPALPAPVLPVRTASRPELSIPNPEPVLSALQSLPSRPVLSVSDPPPNLPLLPAKPMPQPPKAEDDPPPSLSSTEYGEQSFTEHGYPESGSFF